MTSFWLALNLAGVGITLLVWIWRGIRGDGPARDEDEE
jgi:hypothetical protein